MARHKRSSTNWTSSITTSKGRIRSQGSKTKRFRKKRSCKSVDRIEDNAETLMTPTKMKMSILKLKRMVHPKTKSSQIRDNHNRRMPTSSRFSQERLFRIFLLIESPRVDKFKTSHYLSLLLINKWLKSMKDLSMMNVKLNSIWLWLM